MYTFQAISEKITNNGDRNFRQRLSSINTTATRREWKCQVKVHHKNKLQKFVTALLLANKSTVWRKKE